MDLGEHTEQRRLIGQQPDQSRLAVGVIADRQPIKPIGPTIRQPIFNLNLINARLIEGHCD